MAGKSKILCFLVCMLFLAGCSKGAATEETEAETEAVYIEESEAVEERRVWNLFMDGAGIEEPRRAVVYQGARKAALKTGNIVEIVEVDGAEVLDQLTRINDAFNEEYHGLAAALLDTSEKSYGELAGWAEEADVPFIGIQTDEPAFAAEKMRANIWLDHYASGEIAAQQMYALVRGKINEKNSVHVGAVCQNISNLEAMKRNTGFIERLRTLLEAGGYTVRVDGYLLWADEEVQGPDEDEEEQEKIDVIIDGMILSDTSRGAALKNIRDLVGVKEAAVIFTADIFSGEVLLEVNEEQQFLEKGTVKAAGSESSKKLREALKKGQLTGLILSDLLELGYQAVEAMAAGAEKEKISDVPVQGLWCTAENMEEEQIQLNLLD